MAAERKASAASGRTAKEGSGARAQALQQILKIEALRHHRERPVGGARPLLLRAVAIELDAVLVGVAEIERFADAVIAGAVELDAGLDQPAERVGERRARRVEDGDVVEPGRAGGGGRPPLLSQVLSPMW